MGTILYRAVGHVELDLIEKSGWKKFPPRLPHQPIFYPVLFKEYAIQMATDWNLKFERESYVTEFEVNTDFLNKYEIKTVGSSKHQEYWIPAEELEEFNNNIQGKIKLIKCYYLQKF